MRDREGPCWGEIVTGRELARELLRKGRIESLARFTAQVLAGEVRWGRAEAWSLDLLPPLLGSFQMDTQSLS